MILSPATFLVTDGNWRLFRRRRPRSRHRSRGPRYSVAGVEATRWNRGERRL